MSSMAELSRLAPNVSGAERWASIASGLGLIVVASRRGSPLGRLAAGLAGLSLLGRGLTRYCPMKAAMTGQASFGVGMGEQVRRAAQALRLRSGGAASIESLEDLYLAELQELASAEDQLVHAVDRISRRTQNVQLIERLGAYLMEIRSRRRDIERFLREREASPEGHPD